MGKNKLQKFAEMEAFPHVFQHTSADLLQKPFEMRGQWREQFFKNDNPIVLELGCGKGEYTVALGKLYPDKNFIGIDIKGARIWTGARQSHEAAMRNVAFLRTNIEMINRFFAQGEVDEIWLTFPDPQMKKVRKRLTATNFMHLYQQIVKPNGIVHLKTDSNFMFIYTSEMVKANNFNVLFSNGDLYHSDLQDSILSIQTYYEKQWLDRGLTIKYIKFELPEKAELVEPDVEIEKDSYRSFNRNQRCNTTPN
ncbi:MAG: tRNA (guanosine(46)-N7)-methyltransferase TrmB [Prevotellaceae bacterium]|jgi:tRNA (guanine-N7-)-methyltransferase|nr:tRNA (guanosine(46)-N7)-methyltransferase TrmB [Prevotellaceae bacterium]